jgi:hypothetical protein
VIAHVDVKECHLTSTHGKEVEVLKDPSESGVKATIIDYTLSRATIGKTLIAYPFDDESLFEGQGECGRCAREARKGADRRMKEAEPSHPTIGDVQFDVYRQMRQEIKGDWSGYYPYTNVLVSWIAQKEARETFISSRGDKPSPFQCD